MKQRLINFLLRHLLNAVVVDDVVQVNERTKEVFINGVIATTDELRSLSAEVKGLEKMRVWSLMTGTVKHIAKDKVFNKSLKFEDVMYGKSMLFCVETIESIASVFKKY